MRVPDFAYHAVFKLLVPVAKLVKVDDVILERSQEVFRSRSAQAAGGLVYWFVALKLGLQVPKYNVYMLFDNEIGKQKVCSLIEPHISNFRVAKQYYMLSGSDISDAEFSNFVKQTLRTQIEQNASKTGLKKQKFSRQRAIDALADINNLFARHRSKLFLVSGTLLGFVRDGGPIDGDYDVDLGVFNDDENGRAAIDELPHTTWAKSVYRNGDFIQIMHANGVTIDLFIHSERNGRLWHGTDIHQWYNTPFTLDRKVYGALEVYIPSDYEKYLDENYGDWRHPALFWDYSFDTPNREFCRNRKTVIFLLERAMNAITGQHRDRYMAQTALHALKTQFDYDLDYNLGSGEDIEHHRSSQSQK